MNISGFVNMRSFEAAMKALPKDLKEQVQMSVRQASAMIVTKAKEFAPVKTGHLRARIRARKASWSTTNKIVYEIVSDAIKRVSSAGPYPSFQEFGTVKNAAHPYLIPAIRLMRPTYQAMMQRDIYTALEMAHWRLGAENMPSVIINLGATFK